MTSNEIRRRFIEFFEERNHLIVPSAPMVLHNDPTLMFTNAGMNQFKDHFLGNTEPKSGRIADTQKCLRVSGKHNDLEEVGIDTYHHTMFEMLGNWSFGDYFKDEAIQWSWELLTEVYKLPKERLYATVFGGDQEDNLEKDEEAHSIWKRFIAEDRIIYCGKKDNFWEMGDVGPCGPCSEIHIDLRSDEEIRSKPGNELVNADHPEVIEIWNLVFIQYERLKNQSLKSLPQKHVDTGMGFERLAMVIQGKTSSYDSDVFTPLIEVIEQKSGVKYRTDSKTDVAIRVIVDHIRAIAFAIADGQLPSNNKAGYVIRRILRRAVRYGYTFLNFKEPFMYNLVPVLADQFASVFPEIKAQADFIIKAVKEEENSFLRTLDNGLRRLDLIENDLRNSNSTEIDGKKSFELYDTYGFPIDLTSLIAREKGLTIDEDGFEKEMSVQKNRSKKDAEVATGDWIEVHPGDESEFIGYDHWDQEIETQIIKYRKIEQKGKEFFHIVLGQTPFYAESGGQVGDTGFLNSEKEKVKVLDTKKENDLIIHAVDRIPEDTEARFRCVIDRKKRVLTMNNHSATHLMHAALRSVLGDHVQQKGSLVNDKILRFDFSHFSKMTEEEIRKVEQIVNEKIRENIVKGEDRNVPIEEAKKRGAMALFGEKYGDHVRVITFDPEYSVELCGGTHVETTGHIGLFKVLSESSIAAGVRRIEAVTAERAFDHLSEQEILVNNIRQTLKNPPDVLKAVENLGLEKEKLQKRVEQLEEQQIGALKAKLLGEADDIDGTKIIVTKVDLPSGDSLKKLTHEIRNEVDSVLLIVAAEISGKPQIAAAASDNVIQEKGFHAGNSVRELAKEIKGGGGGQPFFATAGGSDLNGLDNVVKEGKNLIQKLMTLEKTD